jgi:hypothetical protein
MKSQSGRTKKRYAKVRKGPQRMSSVAVAEAEASSALPRKDMIAGLVAIAAAGAVVANAAFLQKGPHPAPLFAAKMQALQPAPQPVAAPKTIRTVGQEFTGPAPAPVAMPRSRPVQQTAAAPAAPVPAPVATVPARTQPQPAHADPIGELIAPSSKRILSVQRALADYGYGQIRQNGIFGPETKDAIERFERARRLPVTGQISPRLLRELSGLTGRALD